MKAIVQSEYGPPEVLKLTTVDRPIPQDHEVLVQVHAASVNAGDWHLMRGTPFLIRVMFGGLRKPAIKILGMDMAGQVEAVGQAVTQFQPGDAVFGDLSEWGFGAFAEYVAVPESALVHKPTEISFEAAAAVPGAALAALQALRDYGQVQAGQKVLINGASGGVGSFAVQIAKAFGAEVTAVCSTKKIGMVRSLGADHVVDYTETEVSLANPQAHQRYDVIVDAAAYRSFFTYLPALIPGGTYVIVGGGTAPFFQAMLLGPGISRIRGCQVKALAARPNQADLVILKDLVTAGKITPAIDRCYSLDQVPNAIHYLEQRQVKGKVIIRMPNSLPCE